MPGNDVDGIVEVSFLIASPGVSDESCHQLPFVLPDRSVDLAVVFSCCP